jgi:sRNA-binding carbon storage regulator CsrA
LARHEVIGASPDEDAGNWSRSKPDAEPWEGEVFGVRRSYFFAKEIPLLVLSRKRDQHTQITVPPSDKPTVIDVVLVDIRGDKCRIGYQAPREVEIVRDDAEKRAA